MSGSLPASAAIEPARSPAWQAAERRLHRYLEDIGVSPGRHRDALVERLLAEAASRPTTSGRDACAAALDVADAELADWFERVLGREVLGEQPPLLLGRAAFRLCDGDRQWPGVLLCGDVPPEFVDAMRTAMPAPTPPEEKGVMVEQRFEHWSLRDLAPARVARTVIAGNGRQAVAS